MEVMRAGLLAMLVACGGGTGPTSSDPVVGAWWRCDGESPDCSNLLSDGLDFEADGRFALIKVVGSASYMPGVPLCTTTSKNDTGTYTVDVTAGTISTLNDYGASGATAFAIVAVGAYDRVLRFTPVGGGPGGRQFIAADQSLVGDACMP
jgi:hypothetical protein